MRFNFSSRLPRVPSCLEHGTRIDLSAVPTGGWFLALTPSTDCRGAFQDPANLSFWNSNSFWYYTRPEQARFIFRPVQFEANRVKKFYPSD